MNPHRHSSGQSARLTVVRKDVIASPHLSFRGSFEGSGSSFWSSTPVQENNEMKFECSISIILCSELFLWLSGEVIRTLALLGTTLEIATIIFFKLNHKFRKSVSGLNMPAFLVTTDETMELKGQCDDFIASAFGWNHLGPNVVSQSHSISKV